MQCCGPVTQPNRCSAVCNAEGVRCDLGLSCCVPIMQPIDTTCRCNAVGTKHDLACAAKYCAMAHDSAVIYGLVEENIAVCDIT